MGALCPRFVQTNPDKETQQGRVEGASKQITSNLGHEARQSQQPTEPW